MYEGKRRKTRVGGKCKYSEMVGNEAGSRRKRKKEDALGIIGLWARGLGNPRVS